MFEDANKSWASGRVDVQTCRCMYVVCKNIQVRGCGLSSRLPYLIIDTRSTNGIVPVSTVRASMYWKVLGVERDGTQIIGSHGSQKTFMDGKSTATKTWTTCRWN